MWDTHAVAVNVPISFEYGHLVTNPSEGQGTCQAGDAATDNQKIYWQGCLHWKRVLRDVVRNNQSAIGCSEHVPVCSLQDRREKRRERWKRWLDDLSLHYRSNDMVRVGCRVPKVLLHLVISLDFLTQNLKSAPFGGNIGT